MENIQIKPNLTQAEWEVMRVVWAHESMNGRQLINILCPLLNWKEGTVKSLTSRLVQKGFLIKNEKHTPYSYQASLTQQAAIQNQLDTWLDQTCTRSRSTTLSYLIQEQPLSQKDCQQLIQLLTKRLDMAPETVACQCPPGQCACHHCHKQ